MDIELEHLIYISGLRKESVADMCSTSPEYLSMIISGKRIAHLKRTYIKETLMDFIVHKLKFAA